MTQSYGVILLAATAKTYGGSAAHNVGGYLAIADPKNGWKFRREHRVRSV